MSFKSRRKILSYNPALKEKARQLGFILAGVTSCEPPTHYTIFENWLENRHHATMDDLASERSRSRRTRSCSSGRRLPSTPC
jgi:hypothetical protein